MQLAWIRNIIGCALLCGVLVGCDDGTATIEGTITFDGQPVSRGSINFEPFDGTGVPMGANVEGGKYRVENVKYGDKIVRIHAVKVIGTEKKYPEIPDSEVREITEDLIPLKYNFQSELNVSVDKSYMEQDFNLTP